MAVANWSSSAMVKAVLLPLVLVLLTVAAAGASSTEDGPAVAKSGGRFSETPVGRKLLTVGVCGAGSAPNYNCKALLGEYTKNATCCDLYGIPTCVDVGGINVFHCGSCNHPCKAGDVCCSGVCTDVTSDKNNCGICGNKCLGKLGRSSLCKNSMCNY